MLSVGGVLDIGDKWHAAPFEQLRLAPDGERLVLDKTEAELKAAPGYGTPVEALPVYEYPERDLI